MGSYRSLQATATMLERHYPVILQSCKGDTVPCPD